MAGPRGPVPTRSSQRRRVNSPEIPIDAAPAAPMVVIPDPDEAWHPIATQWYLSLGQSGQRTFYEPSDWATAYLIAESISRDLKPQFVGMTEDGEVIREKIPMKGASLGAYLKAMSALLATEGDRRRSRIELTRASTVDVDEEASVTAINDYIRRVSG